MNKSLVNDCIKLFIITLAAGLILGFVYNVTKDPIAKQEEKTKQEAVQGLCSNTYTVLRQAANLIKKR